MNGSSIFKKVFPVVLVIAMICLITLVTTCAKTGKTNKPEISNPNGEYISIKETINGKEYKLCINNDVNHLHGGEILIANVGAGVGTSMIMPNINKKSTIAPNMFIIELSKYINKDY